MPPEKRTLVLTHFPRFLTLLEEEIYNPSRFHAFISFVHPFHSFIHSSFHPIHSIHSIHSSFHPIHSIHSIHSSFHPILSILFTCFIVCIYYMLIRFICIICLILCIYADSLHLYNLLNSLHIC